MQVPEALPEHLHQLYMESNSIDSLPENFLSHFTQLQYVRMAHNQLTDKGIPPNTFNITGLVELDLSFNKLERIPPVSATLQHLYLQANQIKGGIRECFSSHLCMLICFRRHIQKAILKENIACYVFTNPLSVPLEFSLGSFCGVVDVSNFSRLQTLRLDGNEISRQDIPSESSLCLRQASVIEV